MNASKFMTLAVAFLLLATVLPRAVAEDSDNAQVIQDRQSRLLEMFAEEGIDANEDGALSRVEIRAFFGVERSKAVARTRGHRMNKGRGKPGMMGGHGPHGDPVGRLLRHIERLDAEAAPEAFPFDRHPEADVDGDGVLSEAEWNGFAEQAREHIFGELLQVAPEADANEDGTIDEGEVAQLRADHHERVRGHVLERHPDADSDGDGVLSDEEWAAAKENRGEGCHGGRGHHRGGGRRGGPWR